MKDEEALLLLNKKPTRVLLAWLNSARKCGGGGYDPIHNGNGYCFTITQIKTILATRSHIKNKKEAKEYRKKLAKEGD